MYYWEGRQQFIACHKYVSSHMKSTEKATFKSCLVANTCASNEYVPEVV